MRICVCKRTVLSYTPKKQIRKYTKLGVHQSCGYKSYTQTSRHITELRALNKLTQKKKNVDADTQNHILLTRYRIMLEKDPPFVDVEPHYSRKG